MLSFTQYLEEHYENFIGDDPRKLDHAHEVFNMVKKAYEPIGGIHGSGFESPEDMAKNIPMWKLKKRDGKVVAASLYKDKGGRKRVAMVSDGSKEGKEHLGRIVKDDATRNRSWGEMSGPALSFTKKQLPAGTLPGIGLKREHVQKLLPHDEIRDVPEGDSDLLKHPELKDHLYQRQIGGHWHTKFAYGTPGKDIS